MAEPRIFTMLENNPEVMSHLANRLGLSDKLSFYDVYSLDDPDLLSLIPRPVYALLTIIPMNTAWDEARKAEDEHMPRYEGTGSDPVIWFRQTIINGCGLIGLFHCVLNGPPKNTIGSDSELAKLLSKASPLNVTDRAQLLHEVDEIHAISEEAARTGDTEPITSLEESERLGQHFVAFVKGRDGHLWEPEGGRKGPIDRGALGEDEDALSSRALEFGLRKAIEIEGAAGGDVRFSCIALAPSQ